MALSRNLQYILAGALAVYIVFFTRPAPRVVTSLLASPLSQLAVLGAVVYVGASVSLLVAVIASIAVVLSMPIREYSDDPSIKPAKSTTDAVKNIASAIDSVKPSDKKVEEEKPKEKDEDGPAPAGDKATDKTDAKGSENFSLQSAAPF
jgi:hypothetical protein